jgi:putative ABC transport system permease protein
MSRLVLRGFLQRKLRVLLTGIAIALGVALMAGTYVLTDTINHSFAGIFQTANRGNDVVVSPSEALGSEIVSEASPISEAMLARVRTTPGVAAAAGAIFSEATFLDVRHKRLTTGGAPAFVASLVPRRFDAFKPVKGRYPLGPSEVAVDEATAERAHLRIGGRMIVAGTTVARTYTITGIVQFGGGESFGGAGAALMIPAEAQRVVGKVGSFDQIDVAARPGVTPASLRTRLRAILPASVEVRTGTEKAKKESANLEENLSFIRTFLLVFAYVSLFVGAFIIFNTFSITVAQRTREFGLLRTLGASRRQVLRSVLIEGLLLGVLGSLVGLVGGLLLAPALDALFKAFGADLPDSGTVLETRTIVVSLLVGTVITVLAGLVPAVRATRVPPLAAMREGVGLGERVIDGQAVQRRLLIGFVLVVVLGLPLGVVAPLFLLYLIYAMFIVVRLSRGVTQPRHRVVPALARTIGLLVTWRGITGRLARENAMRQPGRTMITAAALTIGIALVAFVSVLAAGTKATIDSAVSSSFAGNLIIENAEAGSEQGIPPAVAPAVAHVRGVQSVTPIAFTVGRPSGSSDNASITAIEPRSFVGVYRVEWEQGSDATLLGLGATGTVATKSYAKSQHLKVGETISLLTPSGRHVRLTVRGIAKDNARLFGNLTITRELAQSAFGQREDGINFLTYAPGFSDAQVQPAVDRLLRADFPQARSRTAAQFKQERANQINTLLTLIYVLLALSVIVSLFGIVNTLILSIYERTRELGMMRAIGTSRRQIRQMIRYESVITALIGGIFGLVIGVIGAILVTNLTLSGSGYVQSIPVGTLLVLLVIAALAGLLAAQLPARRAARLDVLSALSGD